jgi:hypothetical protein
VSYLVTLDPPAAITGRQELNLNSGVIAVQQAGIDWGEAAVKAFLAEQLWGESAVSYRVPNRVVTLPLGLGMGNGSIGEEEEARGKLQQKIALLQRQGGVLLRKRQLATDLHNYLPNPSFEYGVAGVEAANFGHKLAALTQSATFAQFGTSSLRVVTSGAEFNEAMEEKGAGVFLPGVTYTFSFYVKAAVAGGSIAAQVGTVANAPGFISFVPTTEWVRHTVAWTPVEEAGEVSIVIYNNAKTAITFYVDGLMVTQGGVAPYFDGDSPGAFWLGTPGDSQSQQGGEPLYADIVNASLTIPDMWGEAGGVEPGVSLKLECLPDFYGEEIELDPIEEAGQIVAVLKDSGAPAVIAGDYPARTRIVLTEKAAQSQRGLLWGLRSTFYSAASTAALEFDARDLTPLNGAAVAANVSAYSGKVMELAAPEPGVWHPFLSTDILAGTKPLTHIGSYRLWARVFSGVANQEVRLVWSLANATAPIPNAAQAAIANSFSIVDLGGVRIDEPPTGEHFWRGILQVNSPSASLFFVDRIWLQPLDDGAGMERATAIPGAEAIARGKFPTTDALVGGGTAWTNPGGALTAGERATAKGFTETQILKLLAAGFAIPEGATIRGIEVSTPYFRENGCATLAQLYKAGALAGVDRGLNGGLSGAHAGGPSDLWNTTWTPAQVNAANFGVGFNAESEGAGETEIGGPVTITIYYTFAGSAVLADSVLFASRASELRFDGAYREDLTTASYVRMSEETGDLPRLPPSGMENRVCQLLVKQSRGLLPAPGGQPVEADPAIDKIQAQIFYRPCYLGRI